MTDKIIIPNEAAQRWADGYVAGEFLETLFPGNDAYNFCAAIAENSHPYVDMDLPNIPGLLMLQQGEKDEQSWVWEVAFANGDVWTVTGGCDYTGWDCQSYLQWDPVDVVGIRKRAQQIIDRFTS